MEVAVTEILAKLSAWHQTHLQLQDARLRLQQAPLDGGSARTQLEAEVSRLQEESDSRLEALNWSLTAANRSSNQPSRHLNP